MRRTTAYRPPSLLQPSPPCVAKWLLVAVGTVALVVPHLGTISATQLQGRAGETAAPAHLANSPAGVVDPGFEEADPGQMAPAWAISPRSAEAYTVAVHESGRVGRSLLLEGAPELPWARALVEQEVAVDPYRGRSVRLRAWVWVEAPAAGETALGESASPPEARLSLTAALPGEHGFADPMRGQPILAVDGPAEPDATDGWQRHSVMGRVDSLAESLTVGLALSGQGRARFDDVRLEVLDESRIGHQPPAELSSAGRANLTAFARLLPLVRYFHPSDEAAVADWDALTLEGVRLVEGATGPADLARRLEVLFEPVAPSLSVSPSLASGDIPPRVELGGESGRRVAWRHFGLEAGNPPYRSERVTLPVEAMPVGTLSQRFTASSLAGASVVLTASTRLDMAAGASGATGEDRAELRLVSFSQDESAETVLASLPVSGRRWRPRSMRAEVPESATWLAVQLVSRGDASAALDAVALERFGDDGSSTHLPLIANSDFEDGAPGLESVGWRVTTEHPAHAFRASQIGDAAEGAMAVLLERRPEAEPAALVPLPEDAPVFDLGAGVAARVPLSLWLGAKGDTLPRPASPGDLPAVDRAQPAAAPAPDYYPSPEDRATRLAGVVQLWGALHHFYPYFDLTDPGAEAWAAALPAALSAAAVSDGSAYREVLQRQLVALADGHGWVVTRRFYEATLPLTWDVLDGELILTSVLPAAEAAGLAPGDRVTAVDGAPVSRLLAELATRTSASTPGHTETMSLHLLSYGIPGSTLELTIDPWDGDGATDAGSATITVELARTAPPFGEGSPREARPGPVAEISPGIAYVDLTAVGAELSSAMPDLARADGLVLDMRGQPSGPVFQILSHLTDRALSSARWRVPVIWLPNRRGPAGAMAFGHDNWTLLPAEPRLPRDVIVLMDARAVSSSETFLGIVDHYDLALTLGSTSAGTNGNANNVHLAGGYRVVFTGMRVTRHDGGPHHGVGIQPDVPVERTRAGVAAGRDEVLEAAVERLRATLTTGRVRALPGSLPGSP